MIFMKKDLTQKCFYLKEALNIAPYVIWDENCAFIINFKCGVKNKRIID